MKVFLDGPRSDSNWMEKLIPLLNCDYQKPINDGWSPEEEEDLKELCDIHLYVITPKMKGFHLIAQLIDDAINADKPFRVPKYTVYCLLYEDNGEAFSRQQIRSLNLVKDIYKKYDNCIVCNDLKETANLLNTLNN